MSPWRRSSSRATARSSRSPRDLIRRGFRIAIPYGEDWDFDLIFQRPDSPRLERVQVKYTESDGRIVQVRASSHSLTNGKVRQTKRYTAATIDWLAVFDATTDRCYYVPAIELGPGRSVLHLRLTEPKNSQRVGIHFAENYLSLHGPAQRILSMEPAGFEPATFRMQTERSPN